MSCPHFAPASRAGFCVSSVCNNPSKTRSISHELLNPLARYASSTPNFVPCHHFHTTKKSEFAKACTPPCGCGCPCPFPCGPHGCPGCNCLPPPCNQPPKCIQYMTGYYYYPYGFWFCGPYHVTGTCTPVGPCGPSCPASPPCPCAKCCACLNPVALMGGPIAPQPQPAPQPPSMTSRPIHSNENIKYPCRNRTRISSTPIQRTPATTQPRTQSGGISKFFPFNSVPAVEAARRMPHTSVLLCPFADMQAEQSKPSEFPEQFPVNYTPCLKQSKSNFNSRPRPAFSTYCQKLKKPCPSAFSKSYSDYYDKRNEIRSPIYHKRSKKLNYDVCSLLESPRVLLTQEERDRPTVIPGAFQYAIIPNFKRPFASAKAGYRPCN
ncbi:hypothetical protein HW555_012584 [Spodoptera exigua]|uniref:Uncharacterized protein n=1 Tax=Spodoptera exigua TaxID=7107 RepID=A0A835G6C7_SPOEX|nr:hypothetical protein HW555_012584 [Spodoptera exigua]